MRQEGARQHARVSCTRLDGFEVKDLGSKSVLDAFTCVECGRCQVNCPAWAAGKLVADTIAPFVKKSPVWDKVKHRKLIIPGYIAVESGCSIQTRRAADKRA